MPDRTPEWPTPGHHGDVTMLFVAGGDILAGPPTYDGVPMVEVKPAWYRRLWRALTPWVHRSRVFVAGQAK